MIFFGTRGRGLHTMEIWKPQNYMSVGRQARGVCNWMRLLHPDSGGVPSSERIVQDIRKVFVSMEAARVANGIAIKGVGNWSGKCGISHDGKLARGGKTVKGSFDPSKAPYLHSDASFAKKMKVEASVSIFDGPADDDKFVT